jgi:predicted metal-dependent HD superfamily phosphohydrolase
MNHATPKCWRNLLASWHVDPALADATFGEIAERHAESGRFYHTLDHVDAVLTTVDRLASIARDPNAVRLAAWLHDVVYDSRATDNEERSADFTRELCGRLSIPGGLKVASLILTTKTHDVVDDADAMVLLDADLAILGTDDATYRRYADAIRREYAWVPEADYRSGRRRVLERFLAKPAIFRVLHALEAAARRNLAAEIGRLGDE